MTINVLGLSSTADGGPFWLRVSVIGEDTMLDESVRFREVEVLTGWGDLLWEESAVSEDDLRDRVAARRAGSSLRAGVLEIECGGVDGGTVAEWFDAGDDLRLAAHFDVGDLIPALIGTWVHVDSVEIGPGLGVVPCIINGDVYLPRYEDDEPDLYVPVSSYRELASVYAEKQSDGFAWYPRIGLIPPDILVEIDGSPEEGDRFGIRLIDASDEDLAGTILRWLEGGRPNLPDFVLAAGLGQISANLRDIILDQRADLDTGFDVDSATAGFDVDDEVESELRKRVGYEEARGWADVVDHIRRFPDAELDRELWRTGPEQFDQVADEADGRRHLGWIAAALLSIENDLSGRSLVEAWPPPDSAYDTVWEQLDTLAVKGATASEDGQTITYNLGKSRWIVQVPTDHQPIGLIIRCDDGVVLLADGHDQAILAPRPKRVRLPKPSTPKASRQTPKPPRPLEPPRSPRPRATPDEERRAAVIAERLGLRYGISDGGELEFRDPWQALVAMILSAQTTNEDVNRVTPVLFERWPRPQDLAAAGPQDIEEVIYSTGFYRQKAKSIIALATDLVGRFNGEVPTDFEEMVTLKGVGRRTALMVLGLLEGGPIAGLNIRVPHPMRSDRLGLTDAHHREDISLDLTARFAPEHWSQLDKWFLWFGKDTCDSRKPRCWDCSLTDLCSHAPKTPRPPGDAGRRLYPPT